MHRICMGSIIGCMMHYTVSIANTTHHPHEMLIKTICIQDQHILSSYTKKNYVNHIPINDLLKNKSSKLLIKYNGIIYKKVLLPHSAIWYYLIKMTIITLHFK